MSKVRIRILLIAALVAVAVIAWWLTSPPPDLRFLVLYGNVDLRQADLPFNPASVSPRCWSRKAITSRSGR